MLPNSTADSDLEAAAHWFAERGRDGARAVVPSIRRQFPSLTPLQAIEAAKRAAEIEREGCHAVDR